MSLRPERRTELAWTAFCVGCAVAMLVFPSWQTVPFHWIWITLTFLYGFRRWTVAQTAGALGAVVLVTTIAMLRSTENNAELSEIPLMTCVFLGMVWHVRQRQKAVDEQRRMAERERNFMRDAAHNLRTPLTVAQGHAELLIDELQPGAASHRDATVLLDELRRLTRISDQLLMLGTSVSGDALLLAPLDLRALATKVAGRWTAASGREVTVEPGQPVLVLADELRLRHALDALVENALHAVSHGGRIAIAARVRNGHAVLEVGDTGTGIAPEDLARVFGRFERGRDVDRPGTGLGLAIVDAIAQAHGGGVAVDSRLGAGTTVSLRLGAPLPGESAAPAPRALIPDQPICAVTPAAR
jgi:two-component system OmpR family sensor kinase